MNRFVSAALACTVAISAVGISATTAAADPWHHHRYYDRDHRYYDRGSDVGPAIVGGAILGLAVGSMLQSEPVYPAPVYVEPAPVYVEPPPPPPAYAYDSDAHFQWCASTYASYNGETDTWTDYRGVPHRCISP
jgi:hypothetical protein